MSAAVLHTTAPAKVNLGLRVTSRRADGFHELCSVFLRLDLADALTIGVAPGGQDRLAVEGDPACPVEGNLVMAATRGFRDAAGGTTVGPVALTLRKHIPMEAGLGGGSSDAAATLRLLLARYPGALGDARVEALARSLGADVPFFVAAVGAALVRGVGEAIEPLPPPIEPLGTLLVTPSRGLGTPSVFGAWDRLHDAGQVSPGDPAVVDRLAAELRAGASPTTLVAFAPLLRDANDLWPATVIVEPSMETCRDSLEDNLGRPVLMSGSGSTLVALYREAGEAEDAARRLVAEPPVGLGAVRVAASASGTPYPPEVVIEEEGA